jgi:3-deoxy-D-manno-octulosonic-acid transferase
MTANAILEITNRVLGITRILLLYRLIQFAGFPFTFLYFIARLIAQPEYWSHFGERLGFLPWSFTRTNPGSIWLHAVSVGEVASAVPLIKTLRHAHPLASIYLSTGTVAGRKAAEREAAFLVSGVFYSPLDYASCVRRTLRAIRPALLIILETEIWPNLYAETKRTGAGLAIVNGRISDRTWPRYRRLKSFFGPILQLPDMISAQSVTDRDRYAWLGSPPSKLSIEANLKYDASTATTPIPIETFEADQIWIAASTVGPNERGSLERHAVDEDEIVLRTFQILAREFPRILLILAPRQPARFNAVAQKLEREGIRFVRRTNKNRPSAQSLQLPGALLLDTIGELSRIYYLAQVVFVGGSLAPRGGHNVIEAAAASAPIIVGPHMQNFQSIANDFLESQAMIQIQREEELAPAVRRLLVEPDYAKNLGRRARRLVQRQQGSSERLANSLLLLCHAATLKPPHAFLSLRVLKALAFTWCLGGAIKRRRAECEANSQLRLAVPVVSIGGITIGGSGKTPFTTYLAARLNERGFQPAILTRGYRRRSPAQNLVFGAGTRTPTSLTGDEAQILLRTAGAPIGIGANRYETAKLLLAQFPSTGALLLDDGFQHARLKRDLDIVLIDGLDPFGQDEVVPLGRLREPLSALSRAGIFVVTRAEDDLRFEAIRERLREYNPDAPVFRTRLIARHWRDYKTGASINDFTARRVGAFCGLGNPENFWRTLESLGLDVVFRWAFEDHHSYKPFELQRIAHQALASGAEILVTTEKDRINCPSGFESAIAPLDLAWLEIEFELENEGPFLQLLERALRHRAVA